VLGGDSTLYFISDQNLLTPFKMSKWTGIENKENHLDVTIQN